ncbi:hypothetical protein [Corynebacterium pelargi]|uniref:Uncharacterized protein n=1 Tax=Corynebacterium pelargi TaxID=1471400 RepID=A0A410WBR9_9CORY|nr:hypothetical protein [Corynebacterium pelargi]QAU53401.1 hypothetical protein CPELA_10795 [Corynebacterium pelargi]
MRSALLRKVGFKSLGILLSSVFPAILLWISTFPEETNSRWYWISGALLALVLSVMATYLFLPIFALSKFLQVKSIEGVGIAIRSHYWKLWMVLIFAVACCIVIWNFGSQFTLPGELVKARFWLVLLIPLLYGNAKIIQNARLNPPIMRFDYRQVEVLGPHAVTLHADDVEAVVLKDCLWRPSISIRFSNPDAPRPRSPYWLTNFLTYGPRELAELMANHLEAPVELAKRWNHDQ